MEEGWQAQALLPLEWLESVRNPILDVIFVFLTGLGTEPFLLLFVGVGYWVVSRARFASAAAMLVVAALANTWLKGAFRIPRPEISHVVPAEGWSFPSGHAQVAAALWGWFALEQWRAGRRDRAIALLALAMGVAASRPYLGVHYVHDVVVGFALGGAQVALAAVVVGAGWRLPPRRAAALLGLTALLLAVSFDPSVQNGGVKLIGAGLGLVVGLTWAQAKGWWTVPSARSQQAVLVAMGVAGLLVIWLGLKVVLSRLGWGEALLPNFLRYLAVGLWVAVGASRLAARWDPSPEPA